MTLFQKIIDREIPAYIIYEDEFKDNKKVIDKNFDIVIKSSDFFIYNGIDQYKSEVLCNERLDKPPPERISSLHIELRAFPPGFLDHPIHLQHSHDTGETEGAVHSYCNAVMWQYDGR